MANFKLEIRVGLSPLKRRIKKNERAFICLWLDTVSMLSTRYFWFYPLVLARNTTSCITMIDECGGDTTYFPMSFVNLQFMTNKLHQLPIKCIASGDNGTKLALHWIREWVARGWTNATWIFSGSIRHFMVQTVWHEDQLLQNLMGMLKSENNHEKAVGQQCFLDLPWSISASIWRNEPFCRYPTSYS